MASVWIQKKFIEAIGADSIFWVRFYHLLGADVNQAFNFSEYHFSRHLTEKEFILQDGAFTPLMWACRHNKGKSIQHFLISRGANINSYISVNNCWFHDIPLKGYSALSFVLTFCEGRRKEELEDLVYGLISDGAEIYSSIAACASPYSLAEGRDITLATMMEIFYTRRNRLKSA